MDQRRPHESDERGTIGTGGYVDFRRMHFALRIHTHVFGIASFQ